jgi:hypothetical protein
MFNTRASAENDQCIAELDLTLPHKDGRAGTGHDGFHPDLPALDQGFVEQTPAVWDFRLRLLRQHQHDG